MEIGQDNRKVPQGTGRRIIGQVAGHEIHLEIEDVLDQIKSAGITKFRINITHFVYSFSFGPSVIITITTVIHAQDFFKLKKCVK